jgi:uncharacterized protein YcaQ
MLEFLMMRGEVAIAGRVGRERLWSLPERVYPADVAVPSVEEAERRQNDRRLASLGIARQKTRAMPVEPIHVGEAGEPAVVEGVKSEWRVDPDALADGFEGRTALLSPQGPSGREARRGRRPQGLRAAGQRDQRRREVHADDANAVQAELGDLASWLELAAVKRG